MVKGKERIDWVTEGNMWFERARCLTWGNWIVVQATKSSFPHLLPRALVAQFAKGTRKVLARVESNHVQGTLWKLNMSC